MQNNFINGIYGLLKVLISEYYYSLGNSSGNCETSYEEAPRSILIDNAPLWPNSEPFFRDDELQEVQQILTEFFSEPHTPSYIIKAPRDTDIDPNDGAIAGPSGLCKKRSHNDGGSTSTKSQAELSQVHELVMCDYEAEDTSDVSSSVVIFCFIFNLTELDY